MPLVTIRISTGRDTAAIRALVQRVSTAVSESLAVPLERVTVHVVELPDDRIGRGGKLVADAREHPRPQTTRPTEEKVPNHGLLDPR